MAQITLNQPIAEIHGALSKRSNIVNRQKKSPAQGAELANQTAWQEACRRAAQLRPLFFESVCSFSQITFRYLSYYPATCFAFASGLANIPAFTLYTLHQKNRPPRRFFLHNPKYFTTFASDLVKRYQSLHIFNIAL